LILDVTKNLKKIHRPEAGILAHKVGKFEKSHGRLDPTLRMREVVHARSIKFLRVRNERVSLGRILCKKDDIFLFHRLTGYKKSNQNQIGRVLPLPFASGSIFSSLLSLILINSADACILVMA